MSMRFWPAAILVGMAISATLAVPDAVAQEDKTIFWDNAPPAPLKLAAISDGAGAWQVWVEAQGRSCQLLPYHDRWEVTEPMDLHAGANNKGASVVGRLEAGDMVEQLVRRNEWRQLRKLGKITVSGWALVKDNNKSKPVGLKEVGAMLRVVKSENRSNPALSDGEVVQIVDSEYRVEQKATFRKVEKTGSKKGMSPFDLWIAADNLGVFAGYAFECHAMSDSTQFHPEVDRATIDSQPTTVAELLSPLPQTTPPAGGAISSHRLDWEFSPSERTPVQAHTAVTKNLEPFAQTRETAEWTLTVRGLPKGVPLTLRAAGCIPKAGANAPSLICATPMQRTLRLSYGGVMTANDINIPLEKGEAGATIDFNTMRGRATVTTTAEIPSGGLRIGDTNSIIHKSGNQIEITGNALSDDWISIALPALASCAGRAHLSITGQGIALDKMQLNCAHIRFPAPLSGLVHAPSSCVAFDGGFLCPTGAALPFSIGANWEPRQDEVANCRCSRSRYRGR